jgi:hypothetical protein
MANEKINEYLDSTTLPNNDAYFGFDNWTGSAFLSTKILWSDLKTALGAVGNLGNVDLTKTDLIRYYTFSNTENSDTDLLIFRNGGTSSSLIISGACEVYNNGRINVTTNLFYGSGIGVSATEGRNSVFGNNSISGLVTGLDNIGLGYNAGKYLTNGSTELIDSNCSIFIGSETKALAANSDNEIVIGCGTTGLGDNTVAIGNGNTTDNYLFGDLTIDGLSGAGGNVSVDANGKLLLGVATDPFIHVASFAGLPVTGSTSSAYITDDTDFMYIWDAGNTVYKKVGNEDIYSKDGIISDNSRNVQLLLDTSSASLDFKNLSGNSILKIDGERDLFLNNLSAPTGDSYFLKIDDDGKVSSVDFTTGSETLAETLVLGNTTGANDIIISDSQAIKAATGSAFLDLRYLNLDDVVNLQGNLASLFISDFGCSLKTAESGSGETQYTDFFISKTQLFLTMDDTVANKRGSFFIMNNHTADQSTIFGIGSFPAQIASQDFLFKQGVINSFAGGGVDVILKTDNTSYSNQFGFNTGEAFETILDYTTATQDNTITLPDASGTVALTSDISNTLSIDVTLSQAEVRTLNSANGGFGYQFLAAPGSDKIYVITSNPVYYWDVTGGTIPNSDIWLYNSSTSSQFQVKTPFDGVIPFTLYTMPNVYNTVSESGTDGISPGSNDPLYMYSSVEMSAYEGTLRVKFDYKIIDFS